MTINVLILAGGEGKRLRSITHGGQKVVVKIGKETFLEMMLNKLIIQKFSKVYLAVGYRSEEVKSVLKISLFKDNIKFITEDSPLGTGGAIVNALKVINCDQILVLNGDSFNDIDFKRFFHKHLRYGSDVSILTKKVENVERYGEVVVGSEHRINSFYEKREGKRPGIINLGVYAIKTKIFENMEIKKFSIEEYFTKNVNCLDIRSISSNGDFIDIGTPSDYEKFLNFHKGSAYDVYK